MEIGYLNIFVSNLARAIDFYTQVFEMELIDSEPQFGYARLRAAKISIALAETDDAALYGRHTGVGLVVADLDVAYETLSARGATFDTPPTRQPWGGRLALVADQDQNLFYLDQGEGHSE